MQFSKVILFLLVTLSLFACNTTGAKNAENTPKGFLNSNSFFPTKDAKKLNAEEMKLYLDESELAYSNKPESSQENAIQDDSYVCNIRKIQSIKIQTTKTTVTLEGELDFRDCEKEAELLRESRNKFFSTLFCSGADFSSWNGKLAIDFIKSVGSLDDFCKEGSGYTFSNTLYSYDKKGSLDNASDDYKLLSLSGVMTRNNDVCHFTVTKGIRKYQDGCFEFHSRDFAPNGISEKLFMSGEYKGVESKLGSIFKNSGELNIIINNWSGKLRFQSGSSASYSLSNGEQSEEGLITSPMKLTSPSINSNTNSGKLLKMYRPFLFQFP